MSRHFVILMLAFLCAGSVYAADPEEGADSPLGNPDWWTGDDSNPDPDHPHGQAPPWLWFVLNGRPGVDGRDGRKGDMGEKGDCGEPGVVGPKGMPGVQGMDGEIGQPGETGVDGEMGCKGFKGEKGIPGDDAVGAGSSAPVRRLYTRWGVAGCPAGAEMAYSGRAGTSFHNNAGAGSNVVCIKEDFTFTNVWQPIQMSMTTVFGSIVGVEYHASLGSPPNVAADPLGDVANDNVPCAVCTVETNAVFMQPGTTTCPNNWSLQYRGFVMSELSDQSSERDSQNYRSEFVCVDENAAIITDLENPTIEARLAHVSVACAETNILQCTGGNYESGQLSCAVCSRDA